MDGTECGAATHGGRSGWHGVGDSIDGPTAPWVGRSGCRGACEPQRAMEGGREGICGSAVYSIVGWLVGWLGFSRTRVPLVLHPNS